MNTWIVVADAGRARIFETGILRDELKEVRSLVHPSSRLKTSELVSDRPGRVAKGAGHSAMEARTAAHDVEADEFAATVADELDKALERRECSDIVLVVPPRFLGRLRVRISQRVLNAVRKTLAKDLSQMSAHDLTAALGGMLTVRATA